VNTDTSAVDAWLEMLWDKGGSDLLLSSGTPPRLRVDGALIEADGENPLSAEAIERVIRSLLNTELTGTYEHRRDVDFSFSWGHRARMRANAFNQRGSPALAMRMIPMKIPSVEELGLPKSLLELAELPRGFVLVTGPTGSGKSTTLAALVDHIAHTRRVHVVTIEDPIEYLHEHALAVVDQREVGVDTPTFAHALRASLREDPDVILIGEMRDLESIQIALTLAETGHLVFATLHTHDAPQAIDRIIDVFPADKKDLIRMQLSGSLAAVIAQRLVNRIDGGRVAALEVLLANFACRALVRDGKTHQLRNVITTSQGEGMRTLEMSLIDLIESKTISYESALEVTIYPKELARAVGAVA
jgi:twitching motility protein PilT